MVFFFCSALSSAPSAFEFPELDGEEAIMPAATGLEDALPVLGNNFVETSMKFGRSGTTVHLPDLVANLLVEFPTCVEHCQASRTSHTKRAPSLELTDVPRESDVFGTQRSQAAREYLANNTSLTVTSLWMILKKTTNSH